MPRELYHFTIKKVFYVIWSKRKFFRPIKVLLGSFGFHIDSLYHLVRCVLGLAVSPDLSCSIFAISSSHVARVLKHIQIRKKFEISEPSRWSTSTWSQFTASPCNCLMWRLFDFYIAINALRAFINLYKVLQRQVFGQVLRLANDILTRWGSHVFARWGSYVFAKWGRRRYTILLWGNAYFVENTSSFILGFVTCCCWIILGFH